MVAHSGDLRNPLSLLGRGSASADGQAWHAGCSLHCDSDKERSLGRSESVSGKAWDAEEGMAMVEFLQNYGLWIVLACVFFAMHWFGRGCCGGGHDQKLPQHNGGPAGENAKDQKTSETASRSHRSCH